VGVSVACNCACVRVCVCACVRVWCVCVCVLCVCGVTCVRGSIIRASAFDIEKGSVYVSVSVRV